MSFFIIKVTFLIFYSNEVKKYRSSICKLAWFSLVLAWREKEREPERERERGGEVPRSLWAIRDHRGEARNLGRIDRIDPDHPIVLTSRLTGILFAIASRGADINHGGQIKVIRHQFSRPCSYPGHPP